MPKHDLTKSKLTLFEQCPKRLWLSVHRRDLIEIDDATQARFDTGHAVGDLACDLVPGGVMVEMDNGVQGALTKSKELVTSGDLPIFEGTFQHEGVLVRVDIMRPDGKGGWHVAEVKSTASRKEYQISDLATQIWVLEGAGVRVSSASIRHIDTSFVYAREGDYHGFLTDRMSGEDIAPIMANRIEVVEDARKVAHGSEPAIEPGPQCDDPFACDFKDHCLRGKEQPEWPISLLPRTGKKLALAYEVKGLVDLTELPEGELKNPAHEKIREATISGVPVHDAVKARELTKDWAYPRTYLDFETVNPAIPRWTGTRPYQQIPFQFSVHIEDEHGELSHHDFLDVEGSDPRRRFAEALLRDVPREGSVITYNASFERSRVRELAAQFPDISDALKAISERIVDLEPVARQCWYHRDQRGSWSIKYVLPTIPGGPSYDSLDVQDGMAAQRAYFEALSLPDSSDRKKELDKELRKYCGLDTMAMVQLARHLVDGPS